MKDPTYENYLNAYIDSGDPLAKKLRSFALYTHDELIVRKLLNAYIRLAHDNISTEELRDAVNTIWTNFPNIEYDLSIRYLGSTVRTLPEIKRLAEENHRDRLLSLAEGATKVKDRVQTALKTNNRLDLVIALETFMGTAHQQEPNMLGHLAGMTRDWRTMQRYLPAVGGFTRYILNSLASGTEPAQEPILKEQPKTAQRPKTAPLQAKQRTRAKRPKPPALVLPSISSIKLD